MGEQVKNFKLERLLLVEDSDDDIIITIRKINRSSLEVKDLIIVKNLAEAKKIVSEKNVDAVLLDLNLPDSQSLTTYEELRKHYSGIIVILTSINDEFLAVKAIRMGADDYLVKQQLLEERLVQAIVFSMERRDMRYRVNQLKEDFDKLRQVAKV